MFVVRVWEEQYREELILNVTVLVSGSGKCKIKRGTDTEFYCVCFRVWEEQYRGN